MMRTALSPALRASMPIWGVVQVSKPTKDTAEARHTANVVNELSDVLQKALQARPPYHISLLKAGNDHILALHYSDLDKKSCSAAWCYSCIYSSKTVSPPPATVLMFFTPSCAPGYVGLTADLTLCAAAAACLHGLLYACSCLVASCRHSCCTIAMWPMQ